MSQSKNAFCETRGQMIPIDEYVSPAYAQYVGCCAVAPVHNSALLSNSRHLGPAQPQALHPTATLLRAGMWDRASQDMHLVLVVTCELG